MDEENMVTLSLKFSRTNPEQIQQPPPPSMADTLPVQEFISQIPQPMFVQDSNSFPLSLSLLLPGSSTSSPLVYRQEAGPSWPTTDCWSPAQLLGEGKSVDVPSSFPRSRSPSLPRSSTSSPLVQRQEAGPSLPTPDHRSPAQVLREGKSVDVPALFPRSRSPSLPRSSTSSPLVYRQEAGQSRSTRGRRSQGPVLREGQTVDVPAPFPWATTRRATVHSLEYLLSNHIHTITGDVQCKRCQIQYVMEFPLKAKFCEVGSFILENMGTMHDRAPSVWLNPVLPTCKSCGQENSIKPIIAEKKRKINWLFLLLGQILGCCTLEQLKYACKHTNNHRAGAKDRVLYLTYLALCKQLYPEGPFDWNMGL